MPLRLLLRRALYGAGICALAALCASALPAASRATLTAPALHITHVDSVSGAKGALVRIAGTFPYRDLIDRAYPMQIFIRNKIKDGGEVFICYSVPWGPMTGKDKAFRNGLDESNVDVIARVAKPDKSAEILQVGPKSIRVRLPDDFPLGAAEAQFFVLYNEMTLFSNAFAFEVVEEKW